MCLIILAEFLIFCVSGWRHVKYEAIYFIRLTKCSSMEQRMKMKMPISQLVYLRVYIRVCLYVCARLGRRAKGERTFFLWKVKDEMKDE